MRRSDPFSSEPSNPLILFKYYTHELGGLGVTLEHLAGRGKFLILRRAVTVEWGGAAFHQATADRGELGLLAIGKRVEVAHEDLSAGAR